MAFPDTSTEVEDEILLWGSVLVAMAFGQFQVDALVYRSF